MDMTVKRYMGLAEIAALFGVTAGTVSKWRARYADTDHPTPEPTAWIGDTPGWDDASKWKGWKETLPGRGAGGGPLPLTAARAELEQAMAEMEQAHPGHRHNGLRALHLTAERYGVDKDTVMAVW